MTRLESVLSAIDTINGEDINTTTIDGNEQPKELVYGHYMSQCLKQYWQNSSEQLQIAVRAQHIKRWHLLRSEFDIGKAGYFKWRIALGKFHAALAESLMVDHGYPLEEAALTASIIRKEKRQSNTDSQTLEDVACLVFLQHYFDDFATKHTDEKIIRILQKTWGKMSEKAQNIAMSLTLPAHLNKLVVKALSGD